MPTNVASMTIEEFEGLIKRIVKNILTEKELNTNSELLTVKEAAAYLRMPASTIYNKASKKEIPHYKPGKALLFKTEELDNWVKSKKKSKGNSHQTVDNLLHLTKKSLKR